MKARPCHSAFTLIELLVVVAIIALLVSILVPSLQNARELARCAVCSANQRAAFGAVQFYAEDNSGWTPVTMFGSDENLSTTKQFYWDTWNHILTYTPRRWSWQPNKAYCSVDVFNCPTFPKEQYSFDTPFGLNCWIGGEPDKPWCRCYKDGNGNWQSGGHFRMNDCFMAMKTIMMCDSIYYWSPGPDLRHRKRANLTYYDGHVVSLLGKQITHYYGTYGSNANWGTRPWFNNRTTDGAPYMNYGP